MHIKLFSSYNNGDIAGKPWNYDTVDLPRFKEPDQRIVVKGLIHKSKGALGLDNIRLTTRERCSPRWTRINGYHIRILSQIEDLVLPTLDNYDFSNIGMQDLRDRHYRASKTGPNLEYCARLCMHGSGEKPGSINKYTEQTNKNKIITCFSLRHVRVRPRDTAVHLLPAPGAEEDLLLPSDVRRHLRSSSRCSSLCPTGKNQV